LRSSTTSATPRRPPRPSDATRTGSRSPASRRGVLWPLGSSRRLAWLVATRDLRTAHRGRAPRARQLYMPAALLASRSPHGAPSRGRRVDRDHLARTARLLRFVVLWLGSVVLAPRSAQPPPPSSRRHGLRSLARATLWALYWFAQAAGGNFVRSNAKPSAGSVSARGGRRASRSAIACAGSPT